METQNVSKSPPLPSKHRDKRTKTTITTTTSPAKPNLLPKKSSLKLDLNLPYPSNGKREQHYDEPWTDQEHELFLIGLLKYGKGKWKKISKKYVKTKDEVQVEKHADLVFKSFTSRPPDMICYATNLPITISDNAKLLPPPSTPPKPTLIVFPVATPSFPVGSESSLFGATPDYLMNENTFRSTFHGSSMRSSNNNINGRCFPSHDDQLDLNLHL